MMRTRKKRKNDWWGRGSKRSWKNERTSKWQYREGEEITEIKIDGNDIFITVDLGDNSDKDLACSRYSSITDKLLEDEFWNDITIEFVGVGKLTMNSSQAKTNEFGGKYFDSLYIYENLE